MDRAQNCATRGALEANFVSAVAYVRNDAGRVECFLQQLAAMLAGHFKQFEIVLVNDSSRDDTLERIRRVAPQLPGGAPVTVVNMSLYQGVELCMNAGLDIAIGDFIFEFDAPDLSFGAQWVFNAYQKALEGYDIVSVGPQKSRNWGSRLFYRLFNAASGAPYPIGTDVFHVLSRRALNRVHAMSPTPAYRKAAYAASGLKMCAIRSQEIRADAGNNQPLRFSLAADSLVLYTNAGYSLSCVIAGGMLLATMAELIYTLCVYLSGSPIEGWTTTMLVLSAGFFGVFLILAIAMKYLSLLVDLVFHHQRYLVESVEKLQR